MTEHNAQYFLQALKQLDWSHGYTGNQLINRFNNFPIGWFVHVPPDQTFHHWEDFWVYVDPISESTVGPQYHERQAREFCREEQEDLKESKGAERTR